MKLEYIDRLMEYNIDGTRKRLKVMLGNQDGAVYPVYLSHDKDNLTNQELYELAMEEIYQVNYTMRAENEKFNLYGEKIAEVDAAVERADKAIVEVKELSATSRRAFLKVMMKFYEKDLITDDEMEELGLLDEE